MATLTTGASAASDCVALKCNACPDDYPDVLIAAGLEYKIWKITEYLKPTANGPNTAMTVQCGTLKTSSGADLGCSDIAMIYTGDVLLNCALNGANSMFFLAAEDWRLANGGACVATKLLDYPDNQVFNGLSQGFVSNLVYASSNAGKVATYRIIANPASPTGIDLKEETSAIVSGISGAGTDITTAPDGNVYLWTSTGNSNYKAFRIPVDTTTGYLNVAGAVQVNEGIDTTSTTNNNAGTFCTATYAVGLSMGGTGSPGDRTSNFWEMGVGFSATPGNTQAPLLTTYDASIRVGTAGGAVQPSCPRQSTPDYSFLPPIAVRDTFTATSTATTQTFDVLANDIDPYANDLTGIQLMNGSPGAETAGPLNLAQGTITVLPANPPGTTKAQIQLVPSGSPTTGDKVIFWYKAIDGQGIKSKAAVQVTITY